MRAYAGLAEEKYNLPSYPVLINILKSTDSPIPTTYTSAVAGLRVQQDYRVINLWEVDVNIVFQKPLPSLLPFVPILKGSDEATIREALQLLRNDEQLEQLETVLAFFATFVLESALVQEIMRWDMAVLRESPWYQEILREGEARGEVRGRLEEALAVIELALEIKFGEAGLELMPSIERMTDLSQLKAIQTSLKTVNTVEELRQLIGVEV